MENLGERLRQLVSAGGVVVAPDAHDALVARMAVEAGFEALYVGSLGLSASGYGIPDQSLLGIDQLIDQVRVVTSAVDVPVCVDLEDGGGNAVTTYRNVARAEAAGAAAIQIEDHVPGKSYGRGGALHPVSVASQKIRAAVDARRDPQTVIIGRSEALLVGGSEQEALDRAGAFVEAGADMITVTFLPAEKVHGFKGLLGVPIANFVVGETVEELEGAGVDVALYAGHSLVAHYAAAQSWLQRLRRDGISYSRDEFLDRLRAINQAVGGASNTELAQRYGVI
jgi:2,3-dimethylmalate lyase